MAELADGYYRQSQALLPRGPAWPRDDDLPSNRILRGLAEEPARVHVRALQLLEEADPRTTYELLSDWERVAGLPDACAGESQTVAQRRAALLARLTATGGQSRAYFVEVADALGYEITIDEFPTHTALSDCMAPVCTPDWAYTWRVNEPPLAVRWQTAVDDCITPLAVWGIEPLECMIERLKPAHSNVLYGQIAYSDGTPALDLYSLADSEGADAVIAAIDALFHYVFIELPEIL